MVLRFFVGAAAGLAACCVILNFINVRVWPFEILTAFLVQAVLILAIAAAFFALARRWIRAAAATAVALLGLILLFPFIQNEVIPTTHTAGQHYVRIGHVNLFSHGAGISAVNQWAALERLDILEVTELPFSRRFRIGAAFPDFPYSISGEQYGSRKVVILSKYPLHELRTANEQLTVGIATIAEGTELKIVAAHPPNAKAPDALRRRDEAIEAAFKEAKTSDFSVVIGDFNAAPWTPALRHTSSKAGFRRMRGGVFSSTWISPLPVFGLPIDHIYVSERVGVYRNHGGPYIRSDHWPIAATISIPAEN